MHSRQERVVMQSAGVTSTGNAASAAEEASATLNALLAAAEVVLSAELAELLRHRELVWGLIPPLSRKLVLPYLTVKETLRLDVSVTERGDEKNPGDRDHLVKAYKGLRSGGFDEWVYSDANRFEGVRWARKRGVDLRELKLEYKGERDGDKAAKGGMSLESAAGMCPKRKRTCACPPCAFARWPRSLHRCATNTGLGRRKRQIMTRTRSRCRVRASSRGAPPWPRARMQVLCLLRERQARSRTSA